MSYRTLTKPLHSFETLNAASGGELVLVEAEFCHAEQLSEIGRSWRCELCYARAFGHMFNFKLIDGLVLC